MKKQSTLGLLLNLGNLLRNNRIKAKLKYSKSPSEMFQTKIIFLYIQRYKPFLSYFCLKASFKMPLSNLCEICALKI
jgi:hypothetical protein